MTETTSKPMWTRCPGCKDRVYNDKLDIGIHRGHCPADLQRRIQSFERRIETLERSVQEIDAQVSEAPALDPEEIAPWSGEPVAEEEPVQVSQYADETAEAAVADADEWDDDEDSLASRPALLP